MPGRAYTGVSVLVRSGFAFVLAAALVAGCGGGGAGTRSTTTGDDATRARRPSTTACAPGPAGRLVPCRRRASGCPPSSSAAADRPASCSPTRARASRAAGCPDARAVARGGVRSVVFDYAAASREDEVLAAARWLRAHGARRVVLVGASIGGRAVVTAAARGGAAARSTRVVSLSGERILGAQPDLLADARRLRVPTLWVSSDNDGYTNFATETRQLYRGARGHARPDRLLVVGGADHGIDLLTGPQAPTVVPAVTQFHPSRLTAPRRPTRPDS